VAFGAAWASRAASSPVGRSGLSEVSPEAALRARLVGARAQLAEQGREILLLGQQNAALREHNAVLREQFAALTERLAELERRLGRNPRNCSTPPSAEGYAKPPPSSRRRRSGRNSGGQLGADGTTLAQVAEPDQVLWQRPSRCGGCAGSLRQATVVSTEVRQVADLPAVALVWTGHRIEHRRCGCGTVTMAGPGNGADELSAGVRAPVQYGTGVRAAATYLVAAHHLPLGRAAAVLSDLCGASVSAGSVAGWTEQAAAGLAESCRS